MRNNIITKLLACGAMVASLASCSDFLKYDENRNYTDELMWENFTQINQYLAATYAKLPGTFMYVGTAFLDSSTDNAEHLNQSSNISHFNNGTFSSFTAVNSGWDDSFKGIRLANTFINNIEGVTLDNEHYDTSTREANLRAIERFKGEARFLKAFFYFELFKRYGDMPIVDDWVSDVEPLDLTRQDVSVLVNHINTTLDEALVYLPTKADLNANGEYSSNLGRALKGAAYALKSRANLYAASPLFSDEGSEQSKAFYTAAAENSLVMMNNGEYALIGTYANLFVANGSVAANNTEVIFDRRNTATYAWETYNQPPSTGGQGLTNPTQDLVDAYEMTDGSTFDWNNPAHAADPYSNRDARFAATILYNGATAGSVTVETFEGGKDATNWQREATRTGYYLNKFIDNTIDLTVNSPTGKRHYWPVFRLSEMYLNYAEAMNEMYGPHSDPMGYGYTAIEALNVVRNRVGQPNVEKDAIVTLNQAYIREKIRNERRVEFAFEDHRHWDLRRWKAGEGTLNGAIHGVTITKTDSGFTYEKKEVETRVFDTSYMYLYPIPAAEVLWSNPMEQNPGWL